MAAIIVHNDVTVTPRMYNMQLQRWTLNRSDRYTLFRLQCIYAADNGVMFRYCCCDNLLIGWLQTPFAYR